MNTSLPQQPPEKKGTGHGPFDGGAFTLIEVLVTITLLSVMILGLVAMFDQTRKAFTSSFTQVDVLESGRSVQDIFSRDIEQMAAMGGSYTYLNFAAKTLQLDGLTVASINLPNILLVQGLTDPTEARTNLLYEMLFLTRDNTTYRDLNAVGYTVSYDANGVGSLYRYSCPKVYAPTTTTPPLNFTNNVVNQLYILETTPLPDPRFSKLIDGVVHFKVRAFDGSGVPYGYALVNGYYQPINVFTNAYAYTVSNYSAAGRFDDFAYFFRSNALPAFVEIEIGVLEDKALKRYDSMTNSGFGSGSLSKTYLTNHAGAVHIFRQRIPVRSAANATFQ